MRQVVALTCCVRSAGAIFGKSAVDSQILVPASVVSQPSFACVWRACHAVSRAQRFGGDAAADPSFGFANRPARIVTNAESRPESTLPAPAARRARRRHSPAPERIARLHLETVVRTRVCLPSPQRLIVAVLRNVVVNGPLLALGDGSLMRWQTGFIGCGTASDAVTQTCCQVRAVTVSLSLATA